MFEGRSGHQNHVRNGHGEVCRLFRFISLFNNSNCRGNPELEARTSSGNKKWARDRGFASACRMTECPKKAAVVLAVFWSLFIDIKSRECVWCCGRAHGKTSRICSLKPMYVENVEMQLDWLPSHSVCLLDTINIASIWSTIQLHCIFSHKKSSLIWTLEIYSTRYLKVHPFVTDHYCDECSTETALQFPSTTWLIYAIS